MPAPLSYRDTLNLTKAFRQGASDHEPDYTFSIYCYVEGARGISSSDKTLKVRILTPMGCRGDHALQCKYLR